MSTHLQITPISNGICTITLDRAKKKNALSIALRDELASTLNGLAANPELKVVILTGAGNVFSAGFDLDEFQQASDDPEFHAALWASSDRYHHTVLYFPLPIIAAVNGPAIAGGFDLATLCDVRIASDNAFFSHPEIAFGDVMYSPLHDLVGAAVARELCLTGRRVDASEALQKRLVSQVVPHEDLMSTAEATAAMIAVAPRENLLRTKGKFLSRAGIVPGGTLSL